MASTIRSRRSGRPLSSSRSRSSPSAARRIVATSSAGSAVSATCAIAPTSAAADDARIVVVPTHDHHRGLGRAPVELSRRLSRIELRKVGVDQHDVRGGLVHDRDRLCSGADLGEDLDVRLALEDLANTDPMDRARLDEDDADGFVGQVERSTGSVGPRAATSGA